MTGESSAGRNRTPQEVSRRRVELLLDLDIDDVTDTTTWTVHGQSVSAWQLRQLARTTDEEWQQALDVLALDADLDRDVLAHDRDQLEQLQRYVIRLRNGRFDEDDDA